MSHLADGAEGTDELVRIALQKLGRPGPRLSSIGCVNPRAAFGGSPDDAMYVEVGDQYVPVTLDDVTYSAINLTDEQLCLNASEFVKQVLSPSYWSVHYSLAQYISGKIEGAEYSHVATAGSANGARDALLSAHRWLDSRGVPAGRKVLAGAELAYELGGMYGVVPWEHIDSRVGYVFHSTAFAFALASPVRPAAVTGGANFIVDGIPLRWFLDYDYANLKDRSYLDLYVGGTHVEDNGEFVRGVKLELMK